MENRSGATEKEGPLDFLVGHWKGVGEGLWRPHVHFEDEMWFRCDGRRPFLEYRQVTELADGTFSHGELGFFLGRDLGVLEATIAAWTGLTETLVGTVDRRRIDLTSVEIGHLPSADALGRTRRRLFLERDVLVAEVDIALGDGRLAPHTRSELRRFEVDTAPRYGDRP